MTHELLRHLARLGSKKYQYDYIVHGTKDEYIIPEEMIDTAETAFTRSLRANSGFTPEQMKLLAELNELAKAAYDVTFYFDRTSLAAMVDTKEWSAMRDAAIRCLDAFGIHEHKLEELLRDA